MFFINNNEGKFSILLFLNFSDSLNDSVYRPLATSTLGLGLLDGVQTRELVVPMTDKLIKPQDKSDRTSNLISNEYSP